MPKPIYFATKYIIFSQFVVIVAQFPKNALPAGNQSKGNEKHEKKSEELANGACRDWVDLLVKSDKPQSNFIQNK